MKKYLAVALAAFGLFLAVPKGKADIGYTVTGPYNSDGGYVIHWSGAVTISGSQDLQALRSNADGTGSAVAGIIVSADDSNSPPWSGSYSASGHTTNVLADDDNIFPSRTYYVVTESWDVDPSTYAFTSDDPAENHVHIATTQTINVSYSGSLVTKVLVNNTSSYNQHITLTQDGVLVHSFDVSPGATVEDDYSLWSVGDVVTINAVFDGVVKDGQSFFVDGSQTATLFLGLVTPVATEPTVISITSAGLKAQIPDTNKPLWVGNQTTLDGALYREGVDNIVASIANQNAGIQTSDLTAVVATVTAKQDALFNLITGETVDPVTFNATSNIVTSMNATAAMALPATLFPHPPTLTGPEAVTTYTMNLTIPKYPDGTFATTFTIDLAAYSVPLGIFRGFLVFGMSLAMFRISVITVKKAFA